MTIRLFLIFFLLSLPFWWGLNVFQKNLEDFFFWREMAENPEILTAQINLENLKPRRNWEVKNLEIQAKSGLVVFINETGKQRIIFEKNSNQILPIASLTKLMTTLIVFEYPQDYNFSQAVTVSKEAVAQEGNFGELKIGEKLLIKDLLDMMLIESSNDAAYALAEVIGEKKFVNLMNLEAKNLGLKNTQFVNPTGIDPENSQDFKNYSTAKDLIILAKYILEKHPQIFEITSKISSEVLKPDGSFHHFIPENTNKLLREFSGIVGGKTGYTEEAQGCFLLILKSPKEKGYLINIILGSENRFEEMKKLINWINQAYKW